MLGFPPNLEGSKANNRRLTTLVLLIAIVYTCMGLKGKYIKNKGQQKYISRLQELSRIQKRHSNLRTRFRRRTAKLQPSVWIGMYGTMWLVSWEFCQSWVEELMKYSSNKLPFFQKGLRAKSLIQSAL